MLSEKNLEVTIDAQGLLRPRAGILVAVSGGVDSMVLLHLLARLAPWRGWRLAVAHFNHQLRGRASDGDEALVRQAARKLKLPFIAGRGDVREFASAHQLSLEMAGRELRHAFLAKAAARRKMACIALAHHADDQVELFFLRLLRGTGSAGLAGMAWKSPSPANPKLLLVRPLLDQPKAALRDYARQEGLEYREDASNALLEIQRNRIRQELIPLLREHYQPALSRVLLRLMEILRGEAELRAGGAEQDEARQSAAFADWPVAWQRRKIQAELKRLGVAPEFELIETLRNRAGKRVTSPGGLSLARDAQGGVTVLKGGTAEFSPGSKRARLAGNRGEITFAEVNIRWKRVRQPPGSFSAPQAEAGGECFDAEKVGAEVVLRHWQPGDRFQPIGMAKPVKLQNLFTNQKIPREKRHALLVGVTGSGEIFWVEGLRLGGRFALAADSRTRLVWSWKRL